MSSSFPNPRVQKLLNTIFSELAEMLSPPRCRPISYRCSSTIIEFSKQHHLNQPVRSPFSECIIIHSNCRFYFYHLSGAIWTWKVSKRFQRFKSCCDSQLVRSKKRKVIFLVLKANSVFRLGKVWTIVWIRRGLDSVRFELVWFGLVWFGLVILQVVGFVKFFST